MDMEEDLLRTLPKEQITTDILLGSLKTAKTTTNILDIVKSHAVVMNNKHLMQALRSLFTLQKSGHSKLSTQQILNHPDFEKLCKTLKKHSGSIELNETIEALKVVSYVGVSSDSKIVQVLLQLLRHQVNYLTLQQIIFLDFLLSQMKSTPIIEAMQLALPLIFEIQLSTKLDRENINSLADCLLFATKKNVSPECVEFLVNSINKYTGPMETKIAMSILWSLCEFKSNEFFEPLVKRLIEELVVDIDALNYGDMETTLTKLTMRYTSKYPFYYSDVFCDLMANSVLEQDLGCEASMYILKKLHRVCHTNDRLLNYVSQKLLQNPDFFHNADPMFAFNYINALVLSDYRPNNWNDIRMMIASTPVWKNNEHRDIIWLRLAANLCTLNIYKSDVIEMAFRENHIRKVFRSNFQSDFENLVLLNQAIMSYKPDIQHMMPGYDAIEAAANKLKPPFDYPLEGVLIHAFGGDNYVKTGVRTKLHHHIDHLIVLRKGGYPVAFATPDSPKLLEDIQLSEDSQMVAFMVLNPYQFTSNSKRLQSRVGLMLRTLELQGCLVIPINISDWTQLADFERIPYLMRLIKNKTNVNDIVSNDIL